MAPLHTEADDGEDDEKYCDSDDASSSAGSDSDGSESELDDDDLDEDYEEGEDDDEEVEEEGEEEEEEEEEEESGVLGRRRKRNHSASSGEEGEEGENVGEEELCQKVVTMLQRRKNLNMLKLDECKAYLRKHGLRLTGSKSVCIQRVQEHWRLKDGNGEKLYPKSSFMINCTGDVCTGDVILFNQRVYDKYDIVTRGGNIIGRRTIAGKVVKESYGVAKKQHTFTVEILWSKGVKPLPALCPLLVKGRNLYRMKTFRQRWDNEMERSKVLAEKHKRGAAARHARAIEKAKSVVRGLKHRQNSRDRREPPTKRRKKELKQKTVTEAHKKHSSRDRREPPTKRRKKELKQKTVTEAHKKHLSRGYNISKPRTIESAESYSVHGHPYASEVQRNYLLPQSMPSNFHCHPMTEFHHGGNRTAFHASRGFPYSSTYEAGPSSTLPLNQVHSEGSFKFPHLDRWTAGMFRCQTPGCQELAGNGCVISCCRMCCRRSGRRCDRHTVFLR